MDEINFGEAVKKAVEEAMRERGHANVLIAGRTGVGKSTLINGVFQGQFASTGQGRPVTDATREINKPGIPLTIFDTRGLEMAEFSNTLTQLKTFVATRRQDHDARKHVHVAWVCVAEDLRRVDKLAPMGLIDLVQATVDLVPEGQGRAFVAAQKADLELKRKKSHFIVGTSVTAAMGVAGAPIPFADAALLVPIQLGMIAGITAIYGLDFSEGFLSAVVASAVGGAAATLSGRAIVGGLLKLIPGAGSIAGGVIAAATAGAMTAALGETYVAALDALFAKYKGERPPPAEVIATVASLRHR